MADADLRLLPQSLVGVLDQRLGVLPVDQARKVGCADRDVAVPVGVLCQPQNVACVAVQEWTVITSPGGFMDAPLSTERLTT